MDYAEPGVSMGIFFDSLNYPVLKCKKSLPLIHCHLNIMKVLVDIPDKEAIFGIKVLKSLNFIKTAKPLSAGTAALWEDLKSAAEEVRLHKQGKIILKTAQESLF
jgi:hypothetical protein